MRLGAHFATHTIHRDNVFRVMVSATAIPKEERESGHHTTSSRDHRSVVSSKRSLTSKARVSLAAFARKLRL